MDTLPLETLQRIFTLACTDGGLTGNALSLTSKSVRAASRTARFHTVSLIANPRRLSSFLALYERECKLETEGGRDKPHVRHLYATFPRIDGSRQRPRLAYYTSSLSPPPRRRRKDRQRRNYRVSESVDSDSEPDSLSDEQLDLYQLEYEVGMILEEAAGSRGRRPREDTVLSDPSYHDAARRLFQLVAPDLWTLVLQSGFRYGGTLGISLFTIPFPALRSLTVVEISNPNSLFPDVDSSADPSASQESLFPALTHLHLLPYDHDFQLLDKWAIRAPHVTHLRVSGQTGDLDQLARAVGVTRPPVPRGRHPSPIVNVWRTLSEQLHPPAPPRPPPPALFPQLQCLLVQPGSPPPPGGFCGTPFVEYDQALRELSRFLETCRAAGKQAVALSPRKRMNSRKYLEEVRKDWLEVVSETGAGAWAHCV
ncbi:hypothetical protein C8Q73DRAFT_691513 [Cubamyces lactineus]|nr:hypothetical protein C8Q73DRAFT_691513 [Cubamyces lactineus]